MMHWRCALTLWQFICESLLAPRRARAGAESRRGTRAVLWLRVGLHRISALAPIFATVDRDCRHCEVADDSVG